MLTSWLQSTATGVGTCSQVSVLKLQVSLLACHLTSFYLDLRHYSMFRTFSNLLGIQIAQWNVYPSNNASIHPDNSSEHSIHRAELRLLQDQLLSFSLCVKGTGQSMNLTVTLLYIFNEDYLYIVHMTASQSRHHLQSFRVFS